MWYIYIGEIDYDVVLLLIVSLHIYISYIFKYMLHFFNVYESYDSRYDTIHDSKFKLSDTRYDSRFNYHGMYACTQWKDIKRPHLGLQVRDRYTKKQHFSAPRVDQRIS